MKFKSPKKSVSYLLMQISKIRRNKSNSLLAPADLYAGQDALLYYLDMQDGQTLTALMKKMDIQYATISNMVTRMENTGLITKQRDTADKRASRVYLTDKGRASVIKIIAAWKAIDDITLQGFSPDERTVLEDLLGRILSNFSDNQPDAK